MFIKLWLLIYYILKAFENALMLGCFRIYLYLQNLSPRRSARSIKSNFKP